MIAVTITVSDSEPEKFLESCMQERRALAVDVYKNIPNQGVVAGLQAMASKHKDQDIICFVHDDVTIYEEGWSCRVRKAFDVDPSVGIVGFGGALGIGTREIYKVPYEISQLMRVDYYSNQRGWDIHGKREQGWKNVAVVDGFFMACRGKMLREIGGWKGFKHRFHMYDAYLCLRAIRAGWKVMMVGVDVDHHGGGTSTKAEYFENVRDLGTTVEREHQEPHRFIYEEFRDLLPLRIGG